MLRIRSPKRATSKARKVQKTSKKSVHTKTKSTKTKAASFKPTRPQKTMTMPADFDKNFARDSASRVVPVFDNSSDDEKYHELKNLRVHGEPGFEDYTQARQTYAAIESGKLDITPSQDVSWLDPFNPPNLTYHHVKLLKNIDYSPLIRRANEGGMFSVEDVITILQKEGVTDQFKSAMRREHLQDPFIFEQTFDVFNSGKKPCPLCLPDPTEDQINKIHYTNVNLLRKYVSTSGMILPRKVSGVCQIHQKKLRYAIKNAKHLSLLSYTSNWHVPLSYVFPDKYPGYEDQNAAADVERVRRMEIKDLYDNLVADKLAMMGQNAGQNIEGGYDEPTNQDFVEQTELRKLRQTAEAEAKEQQLSSRIDQLTEHYNKLKSKNPEDEEQLEAQFQTEKLNIEREAYGMSAEAEANMEQIKGDFGDLHNLEKFDLNTSFDEFVAQYNKMIKDKGLKTLPHHQLFIEDSDKDDETPQERIKRLQVENMEFEKKLQQDAESLGVDVSDLKKGLEQQM